FDVLALLITFEELILDKLVDHIQMHLIKNESSWLQNNYVIVLHTVFKFKGKSKDANVNNWDENDFALFKKFLEPFIQYIRFHEISRENFYHYVRPYKKVLPENLYEDLMAYFMVNLSCKISKLPSRRSIDIDSVIIKGDKAKHITNWIEKRITFSRKPFYKFTLTYRATCDGFDYNKFIINNCDRAILVLVKVSDSGKIIGGYHPLDEKDSDTHILSRVKKPSRAIFNDKGSWMNFGNGDLILNGKNGTCRQCNYEEKILNTNKFVINELETFT
ncbi:3965_t:CDS:2, partial [Gigaspora rosea]